MTVTERKPAVAGGLRRRRSGVRDAWRRLPRAAKACALVAFLNCAVWALLVPPFHVPDEVVHVAYAQHLAETGDLPSHEPGPAWSTQENATLESLLWQSVIGNPRDKPPWSVLQQKQVETAGNQKPPDDGGRKSVASNHPPLYYVPLAAGYKATPGAGLITRMYVMRLLSALLAAATVLFVFLFLREVLPARPLAWTVGALAVAFQPMFAFEGGGVNNDNAFYLASAAMFFALARAFRRGLTVRRAAAVGLSIGLGLVAKLTMFAFLPAVGLALAWLAWRDRGASRLPALRPALAGAGAAVFPFALYAALNATLWARPLVQADAIGTDAVEVASAEPNAAVADDKPWRLNEFLSYSWQLFMPRLPFMNDLFPGGQPLWETWFKGLMSGRFGWLDYSLSPLFSSIALVVLLAVLALGGRALWGRRRFLRRRLPEVAVYLTAALGLMLVIAQASYTQFLGPEPYPFYQPRYLLPLLPLYGVIVALAVRGAGRRAGPAVAAALVMLVLAHNVAAQLLTISRYYA